MQRTPRWFRALTIAVIAVVALSAAFTLVVLACTG